MRSKRDTIAGVILTLLALAVSAPAAASDPAGNQSSMMVIEGTVDEVNVQRGELLLGDKLFSIAEGIPVKLQGLPTSVEQLRAGQRIRMYVDREWGSRQRPVVPTSIEILSTN